MIIFTGDILRQRGEGATFVGEVKCSQVMFDEIERLGGRAVMWKTGHSLIKSKMKEIGTLLVGKMSGHIFFADRYFGYDDTLYATCRLLEIVSHAKLNGHEKSLSALLAGIPRPFQHLRYVSTVAMRRSLSSSNDSQVYWQREKMNCRLQISSR
ncbi:MAG: hypothetical protein ACE5GF_09165 [Thermodesulfobacteriota bacterium]